MRVELSHHFSDRASRLAVSLLMRMSGLMHTPKNPAMYWLESVPDIGQSPADDDAHSVVDVTLFHLLRDVSA